MDLQPYLPELLFLAITLTLAFLLGLLLLLLIAPSFLDIGAIVRYEPIVRLVVFLAGRAALLSCFEVKLVRAASCLVERCSSVQILKSYDGGQTWACEILAQKMAGSPRIVSAVPRGMLVANLIFRVGSRSWLPVANIESTE